MPRRSDRLREQVDRARPPEPKSKPHESIQDGYGDFYFLSKPRRLRGLCGYKRSSYPSARSFRPSEIAQIMELSYTNWASRADQEPRIFKEDERVFELLKLPHELRNMIYKIALGIPFASTFRSLYISLRSIAGYPSFPGRRHYQMAFHREAYRRIGGLDHDSLLALASTCHSIRAELGRLLWSNVALEMLSNDANLLQRFVDHRPLAGAGIRSLYFNFGCWSDMIPDPIGKFTKFVKSVSANLDLDYLCTNVVRTPAALESLLANDKDVAWLRAFKAIKTKRFEVDLQLRTPREHAWLYDNLGQMSDEAVEEAKQALYEAHTKKEKELRPVVEAFLCPTLAEADAKSYLVTRLQ